MPILLASPELAAASAGIHIPRMVEALLDPTDLVDPSDELACIIRLAQSGWGLTEIRLWLAEARLRAQAEIDGQP